jgi:Glyoxalase-like domain
VADLGSAARGLELRHGLASVDGGRHPGWGTANRIVPLGRSYLELIAVVDAPEAAQSSFGRWIAAASTPAGRLIGWAARADRLDDIAQRLDLTIGAGSRIAPSGLLVTWRLAGVEHAVADPSSPFFIEWGPGTPLPGRAPVAHPVGNVEIVVLQLTGDAGRLSNWLGGEQLPVTVRPGVPAVTSVVLAGDDGEIVLAG